jgi:hypothetical protein
MDVEPGSLPVKMGRPKRADRYALAERDAEIARMAARGTSYADIAAHFGYSGSGRSPTRSSGPGQQSGRMAPRNGETLSGPACPRADTTSIGP